MNRAQLASLIIGSLSLSLGLTQLLRWLVGRGDAYPAMIDMLDIAARRSPAVTPSGEFTAQGRVLRDDHILIGGRRCLRYTIFSGGLAAGGDSVANRVEIVLYDDERNQGIAWISAYEHGRLVQPPTRYSREDLSDLLRNHGLRAANALRSQGTAIA